MTDPVQRTLETLSAHVSTPPPPHNLRVRTDSPLRSLRVTLIAATLIIAALGIWLILSHAGAPDAPASSQFVLEHLRVRGKPVEPMVLEVRGADALVVMAPRLSAAGEQAESGRTPALMVGKVFPAIVGD